VLLSSSKQNAHNDWLLTLVLCIAEVPSSISELKNLETLNLGCTAITGISTLVFDHHPMMAADFRCAF
jgi:hypothetical protein